MVVNGTMQRRSIQDREVLDLSRLIDEAPVGMAVLDRDLRYLLCNRRLAEINGRPQADHIGRRVSEIVPDVAPSVEAAFRSVLAGERVELEFTVSGTTAREPHRVRTWVENVRPMLGSGGRVSGLVVTVQDVTETEEARAALEERERILKASHLLSRDAFSILRAVHDAEGQIIDLEWEFANPAAVEAMGKPDLVGRRFIDVLPGGGNHPDLFPRYVRLLGTGGGDEVELRYDSDGVAGWFRNSAVVIDSDRIAVSFRNITARWRTQEQLTLVSQELKHRNRNMLTVVSGLLSLAGASARDIPDLVEGVQAQLKALAVSQDLLTSTIAEDVSLMATISAALEPFERLNITVIGGPKVILEARAVMPLIMALSEMATNAVKYGALSGGGAVTIDWRMVESQVTLRWVEQGGPPVVKPTRRGLGRRLLDAAAASLPHGRVEQRFDPAGVRIRFRFADRPVQISPRPAP
jgi:PAS domain S-box-containing protein